MISMLIMSCLASVGMEFTTGLSLAAHTLINFRFANGYY